MEEGEPVSRVIRRDGEYSGTKPGGCGCGWPMVLKGAEEIARYLRIYLGTAYKMLNAGRIPARKDGKGRWITTRTILDRWIECHAMLRKEQEDRKTVIGRSKAGQEYQ